MNLKIIIPTILLMWIAVSCCNSKDREKVEYVTMLQCDSLYSAEITPSGEYYPIKCNAYFDGDTLVVFLSSYGWRYTTIKIHDDKFKAETGGIPFEPIELSFATVKQRLQLNKKQYSINDTICGNFDIVFRDIETTGTWVYDSISGTIEMLRDTEELKTTDWNFTGTICEIIRDKNFDPFSKENFMNFDFTTAIHEIGEPLVQDIFNTEYMPGFRAEMYNYFLPNKDIVVKELTWDASSTRDVSDEGRERLSIWYVRMKDKACFRDNGYHKLPAIWNNQTNDTLLWLPVHYFKWDKYTQY